MKAPNDIFFRTVLPLPAFVLHPLTAVVIAAMHVYLAFGHLWQLFGGEVQWTHIWKGFGALGGAYVFLALASRALARQEGRHIHADPLRRGEEKWLESRCRLIDLQRDKRTMKLNQDILRVVLVALGILSVISTIRATEPGKMDATKNTVGEPFAPDSNVLLRLPVVLSDNLSLGAVTASSSEDGDESASELNRKLTNPVSSIWSISNQFNNFELNNGQWSNNWNFQPVMPVSLTKDWNLITRPVMPFYNIVPHETSPGEFARDAGLGDLTLLELLSPANSGNWVLGAGPTAIFPTATSGFTGQGKYQLGPSVVVGYLTKQYFIGVFPQQWWSVGGQHGKPDTNQMNLQPIATLFFGEGWSVGYSGNILANWNAPSEDVWTVPIGVGLAKVVKLGRLPIKLQLAVQYMPVHPRISGQEWNVQVQITPVIPKLIKGVLFK